MVFNGVARLFSAVALVSLVSATKVNEVNTNVGNNIRLFGKTPGIMNTGSIDDMTCVTSVTSYDGVYKVVAQTASSLCVVKGDELQGCYPAGGDVIGSIFAYDQYARLFLFTTAAGTYTFDATTGDVTPMGLQISAGTYTTCFNLKCFYYSPTCTGAHPSGFHCKILEGAVGGQIGARDSKGDLVYFRTPDEISDSRGNSYPVLARYGEFKQWTIDSDSLVIRFENTVIVVSEGIVTNEFEGSYTSGAVTSLYSGNGLTRLLALATVDGLEIYDVKVGESKLLLTQDIADTRSLIAMPAGEILLFTDKSISSYEAQFKMVDGEVTAGYTNRNVPVPSSSGRRMLQDGASCPAVVESEKVVHMFIDGSMEWWSICNPETDEGCIKVVRAQIGSDGDWTTIFAALIASFAVVPASIYAYRQRQYCLAPKSEVEETEVRYDREKGVSYDPAYEAYANKFSARKGSM